MEETTQYRATTRRVPLGRIAAAAIVFFALSSWLFAPASARAVPTQATHGVVVSAVKNAKFGTILASGRPLYTLTPSRTACGAKCLKIWPEFLLPKGATKATAGSGVSSAMLGTVKRANGALQVTYGGKPLYLFYKDSSAGLVNGNLTDLWGKWTVVVTTKPSPVVTTKPSPVVTTKPSPVVTTKPSPVVTTTSPGGGGVGF
jgi:predicted lipoprotein with Yx(FWY)xxD motif